jgi:hypothetical protein
LALAFIYSGARALLVSHWSVDSAAGETLHGLGKPAPRRGVVPVPSDAEHGRTIPLAEVRKTIRRRDLSACDSVPARQKIVRSENRERLEP